MRVTGLPVFTAEDILRPLHFVQEDKLEAPSLRASERVSEFLPQRIDWESLQFVRVKELPVFTAEHTPSRLHPFTAIRLPYA